MLVIHLFTMTIFIFYQINSDDRDDSQLAVMLSNGVGKHLTPKTQVKPVHTKAVIV